MLCCAYEVYADREFEPQRTYMLDVTGLRVGRKHLACNKISNHLTLDHFINSPNIIIQFSFALTHTQSLVPAANHSATALPVLSQPQGPHSPSIGSFPIPDSQSALVNSDLIVH
ncbi:hypothetical protein CEXT_570931 [Caerostris extrusa]|uniref:Uncharacterized protein n=1 Tax=Caerostris extrusa TaxID=172846 RepID=A0AAV4R9Q9_CAEEX|nr:hypothetical protein CEXT_570931 [Caerostris extrusa]